MDSPQRSDIDAMKQQVLDGEKIPRHVAIIMDGNGRWAKAKGLPRVAGHREGVNSVREIVQLCPEIGVQVLTLYTFSQENWNRPALEISALMQLLVQTIRKELQDLMRNNVRIGALGQLSDLPAKARQAIEEAIFQSRDNTGLQLNLALSYSGRNEIVKAAQSLATEVVEGKLQAEDIDESRFSQALHTAGQPDPDLLIRTGGMCRLSNFLLWQSAYTEFFISPVYWPEFRAEEFYRAVLDFQQRERRFGMVSEQIQT
jgi:undecaprenyl diphosphate synthase